MRVDLVCVDNLLVYLLSTDFNDTKSYLKSGSIWKLGMELKNTFLDYKNQWRSPSLGANGATANVYE